MNKRVRMSQLRRAIELWLSHTESETLALEVPAVAPPYARGRAYDRGEIFSWGRNGVGDPQLYRAAFAHISAEDDPANDPTRYRPLGLLDGLPLWAPPTHADDAYDLGDRVAHQDARWESLCGGNTAEPGSDPARWQAL